MTSTSSNIMRELAWELPRRDRKRWRLPLVSSMWEMVSNSARRVYSKILTREPQVTPESLPLIEPRNRFSEAVKRIELSHAYAPTITPDAPYGYFRGRPIVGETTRINGGIYIGAIPHEAIVVDSKYGEVERLVRKLIARCEQIDSTSSNYEYEVFSKVVALTRETLRYSEEGVANIERSHQINPDDKVTLDVFVKHKVGVARHQTLLAAFLLERLRDESIIKGHQSIESTISPEVLHERLLFTSADGEIFRFDPTKGLGKTAIH